MSYDVTVEPQPLSALFDLKGMKEALIEWVPEFKTLFPGRPNTVSRKDDLELCWIGPDHWLLRAPMSKEGEILDAARPGSAPDNISLVIISDTLAFYRITGPDVQELMAIASPLDTHLIAFPPDSVTYSEAFGLKALIIREETGFVLAVDQSYADMMEDYLTRAIGR